MKKRTPIDRRRFLLGALQAAGLLLLTGCDSLSRTDWFPRLVGKDEGLTRSAQRLVTCSRAMTKQCTAAYLSQVYPTTGTSNPNDSDYQALAQRHFADWRLKIGGLVKNAARFSLSELRQFPSRTQITRHDCVEGWSAIGKWKGVPLGELLTRVQPLPSARYAVFHCADPDDDDRYYYESIDFEDVYHLQTILAYELNNQPLPIANGAPLRLRVERQLGYKMAKYVMRIELVDSS